MVKWLKNAGMVFAGTLLALLVFGIYAEVRIKSVVVKAQKDFRDGMEKSFKKVSYPSE